MSEPRKITRDELYERIWSVPATKLAAEFEISTAALAAMCGRLGVPRPAPGHWLLVRRGWEIERTPLPVAEAGDPTETTIQPRREGRRIAPPRTERAGGAEARTVPKVKVVAALRSCHPSVSRTRRALAGSQADWRGIVETSWRDRVFRVCVSKRMVPRAMRILDAIVRALEAEGAEFKKAEKREEVELMVGGNHVEFRLSEIVEREEKELTEEQKKRDWVWYRDRWTFRPSGRLRFEIRGWSPLRGRRCWADCGRHKLEDKAGEIVEWLLATGKALAEHHRRREEQMRKCEEERERREEEICRSHLEENSEAWFKARRLRRFIRACEAALGKEGGSLPVGDWRQSWLAWAREHADRLDPMTNGFLAGEHERLTEPDDQEDEPEPAQRSVGDIMQEMMFGKGWPGLA